MQPVLRTNAPLFLSFFLFCFFANTRPSIVHAGTYHAAKVWLAGPDVGVLDGTVPLSPLATIVAGGMAGFFNWAAIIPMDVRSKSSLATDNLRENPDGVGDPISGLSGWQPATSIYADGRSSDRYRSLKQGGSCSPLNHRHRHHHHRHQLHAEGRHSLRLATRTGSQDRRLRCTDRTGIWASRCSESLPGCGRSMRASGRAQAASKWNPLSNREPARGH